MQIWKCLVILIFGLGLYLLDISLHISIASKYLTMQECYRSVSHTFENFKLNNLVNLDEFTLNLTSNNNEDFKNRPQDSEVTSNELSSTLSNLLKLEDSLYVNIRDRIIRILPQHWVDRILKIIQFQAKQYRGSDIAKMCRLNSNQFESLAEMALYVCDQAFKLNVTEYQETSRQRAAKALTSMFHDVEATEDALVEALIKVDVQKIKNVIITDILAEGDVATAKILNRVFEKFGDTFSDSKDVDILMGLLTDEVIQRNLGALSKTISKIDPKHIEGASNTFGKIKQENMPQIDELLGKLNVTLATFIMDPAILFSFFGDPEKAKIMGQVQKLLPIFGPEDIESVLNVKMAFDEIPESDLIFSKILALPGHILSKIFKLNLSSEELEALEAAAERFIHDEDIKSLIDVATNDLNLLSPTGREAFVADCNHETLNVECIDDSIDLCANGHHLYGFSTITCVALPGILFGLSDFLNFKGFSLGRMLGNPFLRRWPMIFKVLVLPLYMILMVPLVIFITSYNYLKAALSKLSKSKTMAFVPTTNNNEIDDITRMKRERDFFSVKLHSLQSHGESFFQVIIQLYFVFLLVILGTGTIIDGVSAEQLFHDIFPLTVVSIFVSISNFVITSWRLEAKDHIAKEDNDPKNSYANQTSKKHYSHQKFVPMLTHILWTLTNILIYSGSLVLLSLLGYIEMFSSYLMESGFMIDVHLVPFLIIVSTIPINMILHKIFINNKDSHSFAHAILSSISPCRYIHYDNLNRTRKFLIANQITKWLSHILAWLVYSVAIYIKHNNEDTGLLRLFPIISALVTIPPIFGAIHWAVGIKPSYVTKPINENHESKNPDDSITSLRGQRSRLQITWQLTTILTRFASFSLLAYVYYEHWLEVGVNNIQIAVAITLPYMMVLILGNVAIQLVYQFGSLLEGFMGIFTPNGYLKAQLQNSQDLYEKEQEKCPVKTASHYIVFNVAWNATLHILLWLVLTFYCWECTKILSLTKLIYCFPIAIALWLINFIFTIFVWKKSIRGVLASAMPVKDNGDDVPENWSSVKAYSTQL